MPKYIVHIGPPKVGSKYLQTSLADLSGELQQQGICYPTDLFSNVRQVWHRALSERLKAGRSEELQEAFARLNASPYKYVVLSFEGFFGLNEEQLRYLRDLTAGSPIEFVYYCRRWSERIPSLWKQNVKEGLVETLPECLSRDTQDPIRAPDLNPSLVWRKFSDIFGRRSIRIVSFNNLLEHGVDLVSHFAGTFLGGYSPPTRAEVFTNESPNVFDIELLRALNAIHVRRTGNTSDKVRIHFLRKRPNLDAARVIRAMKDDLHKIGISDNAQVFQGIYEQMTAFSDCLVSPEYGTNFFNKKSIQESYVRQNYLLDEEVIRELNVLYDQVFASSE
jgi:hypothetical protein